MRAVIERIRVLKSNGRSKPTHAHIDDNDLSLLVFRFNPTAILEIRKVGIWETFKVERQTRSEKKNWKKFLFPSSSHTDWQFSLASQQLLFHRTTYILSRRFDDRSTDVFARGVHVHIRLQHEVLCMRRKKVMKGKHHQHAFFFQRTSVWKNWFFLLLVRFSRANQRIVVIDGRDSGW